MNSDFAKADLGAVRDVRKGGLEELGILLANMEETLARLRNTVEGCGNILGVDFPQDAGGGPVPTPEPPVRSTIEKVCRDIHNMTDYVRRIADMVVRIQEEVA